MKPLYEIRQVKAENMDRLLDRKGVTGVGVGYKTTDGEKTEEVAIVVYVDKKKKNVPSKERIPKTINGVATDVVEREFVLHQRKMALEDLELQADTGRYDPLRGGISIGPCRAIGGFVFTGTLGAIVNDRATGDPMLLTNYHVAAVDPTFTIGDTQAQPSRVDTGSCPGDIVAELTRQVIDGGSAGSPGVDGAALRVTARGVQCSIVDIGDVAGTATATIGQPVRKRGRTTGLTFGTVDSVDLTVNVDYDGIGTVTLHDQIGLAVDTAQSAQFGNSGDSGSVVVNDDIEVIGLYFAGTPDGQFGVANPIQAALDALDVDLCIAKPKELKDKPEPKELKDKEKEGKEKPEPKELKDKEKEKEKEIAKEKPEPKELKEKEKEKEILKELFADKPPFKELKDIFEGPNFPFAQGQMPQAQAAAQPRGQAGGPISVDPQGTECVALSTIPVGPQPNPWTLGSFTFEAFDFNGAQAANNEISTFGTITGLNCNFRLEIRLAKPCHQVILALATFASPATVEAFNQDGSLAGTATTTSSGTIETLVINGTAIRRVVIRAPQDETLLVRFCCREVKGKDKFEKLEKIEKVEKIEKPEKLEKIEKPEKPEGKEFKDKPERKELKDKDYKEKPERKELKDKDFKEKPEPKEVKEKDLKDFKDKPEPKELKEKEKEFKENFKDKVEIKEVFEKIFDSPITPVEPIDPRQPGFGGTGGGAQGHFISRDHRPDLSGGALKYEPDIGTGGGKGPYSEG